MKIIMAGKQANISPPPEGLILEAGRERLGISQNEAGRRATMSGARWRQLVHGRRDEGTTVIVGRAETIARMAMAVGLSADAFTQVRPDVAEVLSRQPPALDGELSLGHVLMLLDNIRTMTSPEVFVQAVQISLNSGVFPVDGSKAHGDGHADGEARGDGSP